MKTYSNDIWRNSLLSAFIILASLALITIDACQSDRPTLPDNAPAGSLQFMKVWGDSQAGLVSAELPRDLIVKIGVDEGPGVKDVAVNYQVLSGTVTINPSVAYTNVNGLARARVQLWAEPGEFTIQATSEGFEPITFTGLAVPPVTAGYRKSVGEITLSWHHPPAEGFRCLSILRTTEDELLPLRADTLLIDSSGLDSTFTDCTVIADETYTYTFNLDYGESYHVDATSISATDSMILDLGADIYDLVCDPIRQRLYVMLPDNTQITVISLDQFTIERNIRIGATHMCLSRSGDVLYVPRFETLYIFDLDTWLHRAVNVSALSNSHHAHDALEFLPGHVLVVSGRFPGSGPVYFAEYIRDPVETVSRVPYTGLYPSNDNRFQLSADSNSIFLVSKQDVGLVVYKFNIVGDSLPFAALRYFNQPIPYPFSFRVSKATGLLYLCNGMVIDSASLDTVANTGISGPISFSPDGSLLYIAEHIAGTSVDSLRVLDAASLQIQHSVLLPRGTNGVWVSPIDPRIIYVSGRHKLTAVKVEF